MKKVIASFILFLTLFSASFSQTQKGKSYYLINIDENIINSYDKHILDSLLPVFHKTTNDSVKLRALKYFSSVLSDERLWVPYNNLLYKVTEGKSDTMSVLFNADALNNRGYEYQYLRNKVDSAILFYNMAFHKNKQIENANGMGTVLNNLAYIYQHQGNITKSIDLYSEANTYFIKSKYYDGMVSISINLGDIYFDNEDYQKAEDCFNNALAYSSKASGQYLSGNVFYQLGAIKKHNHNINGAFHYYNKAAGVYKSQANYARLSLCYINLAELYLEIKDPQNARISCGEAMKYVEKSNDPYIKSSVFDFLSFFHTSQKEFDLTKLYADSSYYYAKKLGYPELIYKSALKLSGYYNWKKQYELAYVYLKEATQMNDSINNGNIKKSILKQQFKSDFEKKELELKLKQDKKDAQSKAEKKRQQYVLFAVILALIATLIVVYVVYRNYASKKKSALVLEEKNKIIYSQKQEVEVKQKEIIDSINYAQKIQSAVLTSDEVWKKISPEYFIIFFPKDIVSGDFYWAYNTLNNRSIFALADCTGHGVPGGFMSMLGNSFLNELIVENKLFKADTVLNKLRDKIIKALGQKGAEDRKDGMDMGLCVWNKLENTLEFSGANHSLWLIRNNELIQYQGDKMPIGQYSEELKPFTPHNIVLQKNDLIVLCTDGFADQFGGDNGKKLKSKNLKEFLLKGANNSLTQQKTDLISLFTDWKGNHQQVDDVSLIMIKVV